MTPDLTRLSRPWRCRIAALPRWLGWLWLAAWWALALPAQAQITVVGTSTQSPSGPTSSLTLARPAGAVAGDFLVAQLSIRGGTSTSIGGVPSGWTLVNRTDSGTQVVQAIYARVVGTLASEPASYTWTSISPLSRAVAALVALRGVDSATWTVAAAATSGATSISAPSLTTSANNSLLLGLYAAGSGGVSFGTPGGMTPQVLNLQSSNQSTGTTLSLFTEAQAVAGVSGPRTSSLNSTYAGVGALLALAPSGVAPPPDAGSSPAANFECLETGYTFTAGQVHPLYTKVSGQNFGFDLVALKANGSQQSSFVAPGRPAKTVTVELFDDTVRPASCAAYSTPVATLNVAFNATDQGRVSTGAFNLPNAQARLRCRVTDNITPPSAVQGCSSDVFTVRPPSITVLSDAGTPANADSTGSSPTATPAVKAGTAFTLVANTDRPGYHLAPQLDLSKIEWPGAPAGGQPTGVGTLSGAFTTAASAGTGNGARGDTFTYSEAGYFRFQPQAVYDGSFSALSSDLANGDCINTPPDDFANTPIGGRYGCKFGNATASSHFGRFMPDHFALLSPAFSAACTAGGFSYMGQPFSSTASPGLSATLEARNAAGTRVLNYGGSFGTALVSPQLENANNGVALAAARLTDLGSAAWSGGALGFTANRFARAAAPDGPYDALAIGLTVSAETALAATARPTLVNRDMDAGSTDCTADAAGTSNGSCTAVTLTTTKLRFGRLRVSNVRASELRDTDLPLTAEFWNGTQFVVNSLDHCTTVPADSLRFQAYSGGLTATHMPQGAVTAGASFAAGKGRFVLRKPQTPPGRGSLGLCVDLDTDMPAVCSGGSASLNWLQGNWSGGTGGAFDDDPTARASYGGYRGGDNVIFLRELY